MKGLIHIYTGNGKGKTTAAVGLGVRACGRGMKVLMVQFLKGMKTGEAMSLKKLEPDFMLYRREQLPKFTWEMNNEEKEKASRIQHEIFKHAKDAVYNGRVDLLILDEIMAAVNTNFLSKKTVLDFIKNKPDELELVLTGRNPPEEFIMEADYVSEILEVKHPMYKGVPGRKGIEY